MSQRNMLARDIEQALIIEAQIIGVHFRQVTETSLGVLLFLEANLGKESRSYGQWEFYAIVRTYNFS